MPANDDDDIRRRMRDLPEHNNPRINRDELRETLRQENEKINLVAPKEDEMPKALVHAFAIVCTVLVCLVIVLGLVWLCVRIFEAI